MDNSSGPVRGFFNALSKLPSSLLTALIVAETTLPTLAALKVGMPTGPALAFSGLLAVGTIAVVSKYRYRSDDFRHF